MYGNPLLNPFTELLATGAFLTVGHRKLLAELAGVISQDEYEGRQLHGMPNVGKSPLLRRIAGDGFLSPLHDQFLEPYRDQPQRVFTFYVSGWIKSIHPIALIYKEYTRRFRGYSAWLPTIDEAFVQNPLPELGDLAGPDSNDIEQALDLLESHLLAMRDAGIRVVMVLDDFDSDWAFGALTPNEAKRITAWRQYLSLICATERLLEDVNPEARKIMSPLFKRLTMRQVANLSPGEVKALMDNILDGAKEKLPPNDVEQLILYSGGFPYLLLVGGQTLWELRDRLRILSSPDRPLEGSVLAIWRASLSQEFSRVFSVYYDWMSPERQALLLEMARAGSSVALSRFDEGEARSHLSWLEKYGLIRINEEQDQGTLFSPLFRDFLLSLDAQTPAEETGQMPALPRQQADLYTTFRGRPNEPLSYTELGSAVWGWPAGRRDEEIDEDEKRKIHLAIHKLRAELERTGRGERIVNVRKRGYRYEPGAG